MNEETEAQTPQHEQVELEWNPKPSDSNFGVSLGPGGGGGLPKVDATRHRGATWVCSQPALTPCPSWNHTSPVGRGEPCSLWLKGKCLGRKTRHPGSWPTSPGATHPRLWFSAPSPPSGDAQVDSAPTPVGQAARQSRGCLAPAPASKPNQLPPGEEGAAQGLSGLGPALAGQAPLPACALCLSLIVGC